MNALGLCVLTKRYMQVLEVKGIAYIATTRSISGRNSEHYTYLFKQIILSDILS